MFHKGQTTFTRGKILQYNKKTRLFSISICLLPVERLKRSSRRSINITRSVGLKTDRGITKSIFCIDQRRCKVWKALERKTPAASTENAVEGCGAELQRSVVQ